MSEDRPFINVIILGYIGFTLLYFLNSPWRACGVEYSGKIECKTHLFLETKKRWCQNKSSNFRSLIGQNSHVSMFSTMSVCFEFIPYKNKSCILEPVICLGNLYISWFWQSLSLTLSLLALSSEWPTVPNNLTVSDTQTKNEKIYSQQNYVHSYIEISIFTILQYTKFSMDVDISHHLHIHTFSQLADSYFAAMYFLVPMHTYIHTHTHTHK